MLDRIYKILIKLGKKYRRVRRMFLNTNLKKRLEEGIVRKSIKLTKSTLIYTLILHCLI